MGNGTATELIESLQRLGPKIQAKYRKSLAAVAQRFSVEDVLQETAIRILIGASKGQADGVQYRDAWIMKVTKNTVISMIKSNVAIKRNIAAEIAEQSHTVAASEKSVSEELIVKHQIKHMFACIDRLSHQRQAVLRMRFINAMSYEDIAKQLGMTMDAARTSVSQALADARKEFNQQNLPGFE